MIGSTIEILIQENHWTQAKFAELANLTPAAVSQYISGKREPSIKAMLRMCRAFGITPNDFLGYHSLTKHEAKLEITIMKEKLRQISQIVQR
jgi:transcriptional regulator with XRE-family HTH domain